MEMSDPSNLSSVIQGFKTIWIGLETWQQMVVGCLLALVLILCAYYQFFIANTEEHAKIKKTGPLAKFGWSNSDIKLAGIGAAIFIAIIIGAQFIV